MMIQVYRFVSGFQKEMTNHIAFAEHAEPRIDLWYHMRTNMVLGLDSKDFPAEKFQKLAEHHLRLAADKIPEGSEISEVLAIPDFAYITEYQLQKELLKAKYDEGMYKTACCKCDCCLDLTKCINPKKYWSYPAFKAKMDYYNQIIDDFIIKGFGGSSFGYVACNSITASQTLEDIFNTKILQKILMKDQINNLIRGQTQLEIEAQPSPDNDDEQSKLLDDQQQEPENQTKEPKPVEPTKDQQASTPEEKPIQEPKDKEVSKQKIQEVEGEEPQPDAEDQELTKIPHSMWMIYPQDPDDVLWYNLGTNVKEGWCKKICYFLIIVAMFVF